jgi:hypothetical protein
VASPIKKPTVKLLWFAHRLVAERHDFARGFRSHNINWFDRSASAIEPESKGGTMSEGSKTKIYQRVAIAAVIVAVFALAFGLGQHRSAQMSEYAKVNDCEWVGYTIDRDPVCK